MILCLGSLYCFKAKSQSLQTLSLKPAFFQIKESFNYGIVNDGLNVGFEYSLQKEIGTTFLTYAPQFGFGANYARGLGMAIQFQPVDLFYGWKIGNNKIILGPYLSTNYQWQLYPELQSGHMYWFTNIELGSKLIMDLDFLNKSWRINFSNAFFGLVSRPETQPANETYFYALAVSDWIQNVHSDLSFGFNNIFNHTILGIELNSNKRMNLGYEFDYFGYFEEPRITFLSHAITIKWKLGK